MAERDISGCAGDSSLEEYDAVLGELFPTFRKILLMLLGLNLKLKSPQSFETLGSTRRRQSVVTQKT